MKMISIGQDVIVPAVKIKAIMSPQGSNMRRLRNEKYPRGELYDMCRNKSCQAMVLIDECLFLSPFSCKEIQQKIEENTCSK